MAQHLTTAELAALNAGRLPQHVRDLRDAELARIRAERPGGDLRLLNRVDQITIDRNVARALAHAERRTTALGGGTAVPARRRPLRLALAAVAAVGALLVGGTAVAPQASAQIVVTTSTPYTVARPLEVVVAGPTARIVAPLWSTQPGPMVAAAGMQTRSLGYIETIVWGRGRGAELDWTLPSTLLTPGPGVVELADLHGEDPVTRLPIAVRRQSRVSATAIPLPGGVVVSGRATHYDIGTGRYAGDQKSPVLVQRLVGARWVTVATAMTSPDGTFLAAVRSAPGKASLRGVRPVGRDVTGATSRTVVVPVPLGSVR